MKLVTYNDQRLGLLVGDKVIDIKRALQRHDALPEGATMIELIENFPLIKAQLERLEAGAGDAVEITSISLLPPIMNPSKVICTVDNYPSHAAEDATEIFPKPIFFLKPANALIGSGGTVVLPKEARRVDHELELAVVIGKKCRGVPAREALSYVFGYTIFLDMSARDFRTIPYSWFSMKGWDTFGPIGPAIVTSDEVGSPSALEMKLWVNGQLRMHGNTRDMIFDVAELIEAVSEVTTLLPGDVIATGTVEGVTPVFEGDVIIAEIQKLGKLEVSVVRSSHVDIWHTKDFPEHYAAYRERDTADKGPDVMAPKKMEDL